MNKKLTIETIQLHREEIVITEGKYNGSEDKLKEELAKEFRIDAKEDTESLDNILTKHVKETDYTNCGRKNSTRQ